jgi:hypothetical protein
LLWNAAYARDIFEARHNAYRFAARVAAAMTDTPWQK